MSPLDAGTLNVASAAVNKAWDVSVGMGVAIGVDFFLGFIVLLCLKVLFGDRKGSAIRQEKDTESRVLLATAVQDLTTTMRNFKCSKL